MLQFPRVSLSVKPYGHRDQRVRQLFCRHSREGYGSVRFLNDGQCLQSILRSTVRRPRYMWTMTSPSTLEALIFSHGITLINSSIVTKTLNCTSTYVMRRLIAYTVQKILKAWIALPHAAKMRPFPKILLFLPLIQLHTKTV